MNKEWDLNATDNLPPEQMCCHGQTCLLLLYVRIPLPLYRSSHNSGVAIHVSQLHWSPLFLSPVKKALPFKRTSLCLSFLLDHQFHHKVETTEFTKQRFPFMVNNYFLFISNFLVWLPVNHQPVFFVESFLWPVDQKQITFHSLS